MPSLEHTKTPWEKIVFVDNRESGSDHHSYKVTPQRGVYGSMFEPDADLIVKAVNSYEANQALIAKLTEALERIYEECNNDGRWERMIERIELEAVSALSLAKSETPQ